MAGVIALSACQTPGKGTDEIIGKNNPEIINGLMTPEVLMSFGRVSGAELSPDKQKILFGVTYVSVPENKSNRELFVMNVDGSDKQQITHTSKSEQNAVWLNGGEQIAFLTSESGSSQIWIMNADGSNRKQITDMGKGIDGFSVSPDGKKIVFIQNVKYGKRSVDVYPDLPKATGRIIDDLMYKHWDEWVEEIPHPFIADFNGKEIMNISDILEGQPYEAPMKPFGGIEDFAWTSDSKKIAYTCRKKTGKAYALSTNSDIYLYDIESKTDKNLTEGMMGYDTNPRISPDGRYMAWMSMERDGYESDKNRLFVMNLTTGEKQYLTDKFDYSLDVLQWGTDNNTLFFICAYKGTEQIFRIDRITKQITLVTEGDYDYASICPVSNDLLITQRHSLSMPDEIYSINIPEKKVSELSFENKEILEKLNMGKVEGRWIGTTDNKKMLTWIVYPPHFDPNKKYPTLLYCQGGPQSPVTQFWSYRWNLQIMAANGYIVVAPNRRGLYGFGQEWLEQISGDYGGQCMLDYFSAIDTVKQERYVDADHLGAVGASFGGYSVYWLAGHHNKRFKAFIAHAGIFNTEQQYVETEEMWFANWDLGGPFWDKNNPVAQRSYANSPHKFVDKWDTPILVSHGERDYRILASQGMAAYDAAMLRGIPAELLIFPDENHWVAQPQNAVLWQRVFFRWLDHWLKPESTNKK
ncbi:S9 family peptidase [Coprobacter sp. LH1063]|uniref:S9 family peptidase n=1 Tax=Coprobacter tertius TaxID=2944915 RepID=A0ABT1MIL1_9BACT|nr:S9 family peptidase [Coprobacter tertius]MCP9611904.1 S9 family peptidase [Coprobacter tertius]